MSGGEQMQRRRILLFRNSAARVRRQPEL